MNDHKLTTLTAKKFERKKIDLITMLFPTNIVDCYYISTHISRSDHRRRAYIKYFSYGVVVTRYNTIYQQFNWPLGRPLFCILVFREFEFE